jgi:lysophospholipase L1-like esterase
MKTSVILRMAAALCIVALVFTACAKKPTGAQGTEIESEGSVKIVMFGDSITQFITDWFRGGWSELLGMGGIVNRGIAGQTTAQMIARISEVYNEEPDICFFMGGINDFFWTSDTVSQAAERIQTIIKTLEEHNIKVVVSSTLFVAQSMNNQNSNPRVAELNALISGYCDENNVTYLDLNSVLSSGGSLEAVNTKDGIHLTRIAYEKWKDLILPVIADWENTHGNDKENGVGQEID